MSEPANENDIMGGSRQGSKHKGRLNRKGISDRQGLRSQSTGIRIDSFLQQNRVKKTYNLGKNATVIFSKKITKIENEDKTIPKKTNRIAQRAQQQRQEEIQKLKNIGDYMLSEYRSNFRVVVISDITKIVTEIADPFGENQVVTEIADPFGENQEIIIPIANLFKSYFVSFPNLFDNYTMMNAFLLNSVFSIRKDIGYLKIKKDKFCLIVGGNANCPSIDITQLILTFVQSFTQYVETHIMENNFFNVTEPTEAEALAFNQAYYESSPIICTFDDFTKCAITLPEIARKCDIFHDEGRIVTSGQAKTKITVLHVQSIYYLINIFETYISAIFVANFSANDNDNKIAQLQAMIIQKQGEFAAAAADKTQIRKQIHMFSSYIFVLSIKKYFLGHRVVGIGYEHYLLKILIESYISLCTSRNCDDACFNAALTSADPNVKVSDNVTNFADKTNDDYDKARLYDPGANKNNPNGNRIMNRSIDVEYNYGGRRVSQVMTKLKSADGLTERASGTMNAGHIVANPAILQTDQTVWNYIFPIFNADGSIAQYESQVRLSLFPYRKTAILSNDPIFSETILHGNNSVVWSKVTLPIAQSLFVNLDPPEQITGQQVAILSAAHIAKTGADENFGLQNSDCSKLIVRSNDAAAMFVHLTRALLERLYVDNPATLGELLSAAYSEANKLAGYVKVIVPETLKYCELYINARMVGATDTEVAITSVLTGGQPKSNKQKGGNFENLKKNIEELLKFKKTTTSPTNFINQLLSSNLKMIFDESKDSDELLETNKELHDFLSVKYDKNIPEDEAYLKSKIITFIINLRLNDEDKSEFLLDCLTLPVNYPDLHNFVYDLNTILKIYPNKNEEVYKIINKFFAEFNINKSNDSNVKSELEYLLLFSIRTMAVYQYNEEEEVEEDEEEEQEEQEEYTEMINKNIKEIQRAMDVVSDIVVSRHVVETNYKKQIQESKMAESNKTNVTTTSVFDSLTKLQSQPKLQQTSIDIYVKNGLGNTTKYEMSPNAKISTLKEKINPTDPNSVKLKYGTQEMSDDKTLAQYGVQNESTIYRSMQQMTTGLGNEYSQFAQMNTKIFRIPAKGGKRKTRRNKPKKTRKRFQKRSKKFQKKSRKA